MLVYRPSPGAKPYSFNAMRFHLAREWTTSMVSPGIPETSNCTGRSVPLRLSFRPLLFSTNRGAEIRSRFISFPSSF